MKRIGWSLILVMLLGVSGCSLLSPVKMPEAASFTIHPKQPLSLQKGRRAGAILVMDTAAGPGYQTADMLYLKRPYQLEKFSQNQWSAPPAQLFTQALIQSLRACHGFIAVVPAPYVGDTRWRVDTQLEELHQDFVSKDNHISMAVAVQVIDMKKGGVVASEHFSAYVPTSTNDPYGGVVAANAATAQLLAQINRFVIRYTHRT